MINFIKTLYYEFRSYFVPEKIHYEIKGECKKCGKCCTHLYSFDPCSEQEFKFMQLLYPTYRRFYIKGKDEQNNLIFACKHVTPDGLCSVYKKRPAMCKRYPAKKIKFAANLHEGCGYNVEKKDFRDYLK